MKLKLIKPKKIIYQLLLGLLLVAGSLAINTTGGQVDAAMSWPQLETKINTPMRNYCAPVKGTNYDKCTGTFTAGAAAVYNASSEKEVNNQLRTICTPPIQNWVLNGSASDCGAFAKGVEPAQDILGKDFYDGGGTGGTGGGGQQGGGGGTGGGGGQQGGSGGSVPPISDCNDAKNEQDKTDCKKEYRECNKPSSSAAEKASCKREAVNKYTSKQAVDGGAAVGGGGGGESASALSIGKEGTNQCGNLPDEADNFKTKINFGCLGKQGPSGLGPIQDLVFALIRFLSAGVGVILTISIVAAGIQYTTAEGNADASQKAKKRIQNSVIGLVIFIFAWSAMQFLIPGGVFSDSTIPIQLLVRSIL